MKKTLSFLTGALVGTMVFAGAASAGALFSNAGGVLNGVNDSLHIENIDMQGFEDLQFKFKIKSVGVDSHTEKCGENLGDCLDVMVGSTNFGPFDIPWSYTSVGPLDISDYDNSIFSIWFTFTSSSSQEAVEISDIKITNVSEPGTLAVVGLGLAGLGLARRRRHR